MRKALFASVSALLALCVLVALAPYGANAAMRKLTVRNGDTLLNLLSDAGVDSADAMPAVVAFSEIYDVARLKPKQCINLRLAPDGSAVQRLSMKTSFDKEVVVSRNHDGDFVAEEKALPTTLQVVKADFTLRRSFYQDGLSAGVPAPVLASVVKMLSYQLDFQRESKKGDRYYLLYEQRLTKDNARESGGDIVSLTMIPKNGEKFEIYRFADKNGEQQYYFADGKTVKRSLLRTPVDATRISSGFGARRHPVLGYTRMHKGVDFAASTGTPIYASGDGVVLFRGTVSGYGNYVRLRHKGLDTAYGHMSAFAPGLKNGATVKQGQVIGYVGMTGLATGPHLHYEVLKNNVQINPLSIKTFASEKLEGVSLAVFTHYKAQIAALYGDGEVMSSYKLAMRQKK
ncbi:MAG: M23 family metallopeptidase [Rickettsiales bacterium]